MRRSRKHFERKKITPLAKRKKNRKKKEPGYLARPKGLANIEQFLYFFNQLGQILLPLVLKYGFLQLNDIFRPIWSNGLHVFMAILGHKMWKNMKKDIISKFV